jgi:hypothetical protein
MKMERGTINWKSLPFIHRCGVPDFHFVPYPSALIPCSVSPLQSDRPASAILTEQALSLAGFGAKAKVLP